MIDRITRYVRWHRFEVFLGGLCVAWLGLVIWLSNESTFQHWGSTKLSDARLGDLFVIVVFGAFIARK